jgi:hypothetical protein
MTSSFFPISFQVHPCTMYSINYVWLLFLSFKCVNSERHKSLYSTCHLTIIKSKIIYHHLYRHNENHRKSGCPEIYKLNWFWPKKIIWKSSSSESTSDQIKSNLTGKILVSSTCVQQPSPQSKVATITEISKWCILLHFGYKICSVKSLNIVWKNHEKMEISTLHIYMSNLGPSNSDGSNTMDGSNLLYSTIGTHNWWYLIVTHTRDDVD